MVLVFSVFFQKDETLNTGDFMKRVLSANGDFMKKVLIATWALRDR